jgi:hypothetical protein
MQMLDGHQSFGAHARRGGAGAPWRPAMWASGVPCVLLTAGGLGDKPRLPGRAASCYGVTLGP